MKIQGKNFLITGANRGIGRAVAAMAAQQKANLYLVSRKDDPALLSEMQKLGAPSVHILTADLATREGVDQLLAQIKHVPVDILFNNAGILTGGLLENQPLDDIYTLTQVNITSIFHLTRALIPNMISRGQGKIINNASVSAFMHFPCASTYAASKAAVVAFTNCLELELSGTGVSTLCLVTPGIKTRMFDEISDKYSQNFDIPTEHISPEEYAERIRKAIEADDTYLMPQGATAIGLWIARNMNGLFKSQVIKRFRRN